MYRFLAQRLSATALLAAACISFQVLGSRPLRATEFFFEDFDSYVDASELESIGGWQIVEVNDPLETGAAWTLGISGGRGTPGTVNGTPSLGNYALSDSDAAQSADQPCTGRSHDLVSPPFDCTGASVVWLHFDCTAQLNNNGKVIFDVDVSKDDGATWTNLFRRVAPSRIECEPLARVDNADGFVGQLDVDLSAQAANQKSVMVRARQFEPDDDWWIAIDNVLVDDQPPPRGGAKTILRKEDFSQELPGSWTVLSLVDPENTGKLSWNTQDPCRRSAVRFNNGNLPYQDGQGAHRLDGNFAILESEGCPGKAAVPVDDYLITPPLDLRGATEVYLHYRDEIIVGGGLREVLLSLDGGGNFEPAPIFTYNAGAGILGEDSLYAERVFLVPDAVGSNGVVFAFHFQSAPGDGWWGIDDVQVTANGAGLPADLPVNCGNRRFRTTTFDSVANSITCFWDSLPGDQTFRVFRNGQNISGDLPAGTLTFKDSPIPPGTPSVSYKLQAVVNGAAAPECSSGEISPLVCPVNLVCCVNPAALEVNLTWNKGSNIAGTGWRITRNNVPVRTVPLDSDSFTDTVPAAGEYEYALILNQGDPGQCPDLPLRCRARIPSGDLPYIFFDDFEGYSDDADLNGSCWAIHEVNNPAETAAWTLTNPGGRGNPPVANGTASTGQFLVSDSDAAANADGQGSGRSHDIWSPPFSCLGKDTVWLHMGATIVLNNNGLCIFDVDVTTDNGDTWTNVFRRIAPARSSDPVPLADIPAGFPGGPQIGNSDGFFGQLDIDLSAHVANKPHVRLRLRQFEPDDDWWMAVDDVLVDSVPTVGGSAVLLNESFDNGIPVTWTVSSAAGELAPWLAEDPCNASLLHFNNGQFFPLGDPAFPDGPGADGRRIHHLDDTFALAFLDPACTPQGQDEYLITPALDCTEATAVYLHFKSALLVTQSIAEVLLSLDGGQNFDIENPVFSYHRDAGLLRDSGNPDMTYDEHVLEVLDAVGADKVAFAFHFVGTGSSVAGWGIDDVKVTANGVQVGPTFHRGDVDDNGKLELTDAVRILGFLFLGGTVPSCMDSADADDNGKLELTDAVRILGFLFLGGPPPSAPGPPPDACGLDPTPGDAGGDMGCISYTKC